MAEKAVYTLGAIVTVVILMAGFLLVNRTRTPVLTENESADMQVIGDKFHDWGEIDINGGNVEHIFEVKNVGDVPLEITNFKTSCMCTEVKVIINGESSPSFGMHTRSGWKGSVLPGQTAQIVVVFDPMFHGPQATGPITRLVSFNTNDSQHSSVEFKLTGNVVSK